MFRYLLIILLLPIAVGASAQKLPERSEVRRGNRLYDKGDYERSIERYGRALEFAPGQFEATYDLGNALYRAERFDAAEQTMRQAAADSLRTDAERAEAFYNLGNAQFRQQKYREALESYKQSLRLNPADLEAKYNYAYTKRLLDRDEQGGGGDDAQQNPQQGDQDRQQGGDGAQQPQEGAPSEPQEGGESPQSDGGDPNDPNGGQEEAQPVPDGISEQEQQQMLDAIQAQEDRTQEKLKERRGAVVRGKKNW